MHVVDIEMQQYEENANVWCFTLYVESKLHNCNCTQYVNVRVH